MENLSLHANFFPMIIFISVRKYSIQNSSNGNFGNTYVFKVTQFQPDLYHNDALLHRRTQYTDRQQLAAGIYLPDPNRYSPIVGLVVSCPGRKERSEGRVRKVL